MLPIKDRNTKTVIFTGLAALTLLLGLSQTAWLESIENLSLDARFMLRGARAFPESIVAAGIDEASLDVLGHWPWSRDKHAALLELLSNEAFRPAAIGYDILFEQLDAKSLESDELFAEQAARFGGDLILAYFFEKGSVSSVEAHEERDKILERFALRDSGNAPEHLENMDKLSAPYDALLQTGSLAFANNPIDRDGRTRRLRLLLRYKDRIYPSFALMSAMKLLGAEPGDIQLEKSGIVITTERSRKRVIPVTPEGDMIINFWNIFREIPKISFLELLREGQLWMKQNKEPIKLKSLKDKFLIVGATALGLEDRRVTPFHAYDPASSVQAQAIANIVEGKFLKRVSQSVGAFITLILGLLVIALTATQRALRAFGFIFLAAFLYLAGAYAVFLLDGWIDVAGPIATMIILFLVLVSLRYFLTAEELKRTYAQLLHAEKMASLGTLSASIAHEYRNFLSSISMAAEVCCLANVERKKLEQCMDVILNTVRKANQVSQALLTFARKSKSVKTEGQLQKTIGDILLIIEKDLIHNNIKIEKELVDLGPIYYDEGQISQVLMNMLRNARDALKNTPDSKRIVIRIKDKGSQALLEIEDNGCGIPKKILQHLFEPFSTSKKTGEGTGLGLSVCHGIIRNHGGDIKVTTAEGKGTTWQIFISKK
ncbi:MAG: CHASE2 domain-containing protein [Candidatus Omnitrophica bacterium]|nr:CHASE2 domain-containing protein [Candidatus Omnitrophota bacterium]